MENDAIIFLAKAEESLLTAESEFANGRYNSCANRCYYDCYQAAIAALINDGIQSRGNWSHEFVQGQFVGLLINRRKRYSADLRRVLSDNQILRERAGYYPVFVNQTQAGRALGRTRTFVDAVRQERGSKR